jgi:peroxygenase
MLEKFEKLFSKFAKTEKTRLTPGELWEMTEANRCAMDPFGWQVTGL